MKQPAHFLSGLLDFLSWSQVACKYLGKRSPYLLVGAILLSLLSQLAMVVSFFLPLKVVFLLGSETLPASLTPVFNWLSMQELIGLLVALSALAYFLFLFSGRYSEQLAAEGAHKIIASTFSAPDQASSAPDQASAQQKALALRFYRRSVNVLAAVFFLLFSWVFFFFFYPALFLFFVVTALLSLMGLQLGFVWQPHHLHQAALNPGKWVTPFYGCFFLVLFGVMVADLLFWRDPGFYVALVCLLLVRQLLQRLTTASIDGVLLYSEKDALDCLFLQGAPESRVSEQKAPPEKAGPAQEVVTDVLADQAALPFVQEALQKARLLKNQVSLEADVLQQPLVVRYFQSSLVGVIALAVEAGERHFLIKRFDGPQASLAAREKQALAALPARELAFDFYAYEEAEGRRVHLLAFHRPLHWTAETTFKARRDAFRVQCFDFRLEAAWLNEVTVASADIGQRLQAIAPLLRPSVFSALFRTCSPEAVLTRIEYHLKALPRVFCPQDVTPDALLLLKKSQVTSVHWERWSLEPLGFGLTEPELKLPHLRLLLQSSTWASLDERRVRLAGLSCLLEQKMQNQKFLSAATTLEQILALLDALEHPNDTPVACP